MTSILGVGGALLMIGAEAVAMVVSSAICLDEKAGRLPTEPDQTWIRMIRTRARACCWGGLATTITAAIFAVN